jgi:hypothetical protein
MIIPAIPPDPKLEEDFPGSRINSQLVLSELGLYPESQFIQPLES